MSIRNRFRSIGAARLALLVGLLALIVVARLQGDGDRTGPAAPGGPAGTAVGTGAGAGPGASGTPSDSADRLLFWVDVRAVQSMTDAELATWKERGVDGFVASTQWLAGLGSNYSFTADPGAALDGPAYALQRTLRDSRLVERAHAQGMKLYLGFYLANRANVRSPLVDWFDDAGWSGTVLPRVADLAGAAHRLGFDGLAIDAELYPQEGNVASASWENRYPGNTRSIDDTQAAAAGRGRQLMATVLQHFPDVEIQVYGAMFPEGWEELVQEEINDGGRFDRLLHLPFWDGMTSVEGYRAVRFSEAIFYKTTHIRGSDWDTANQYNVNRLYALFSRRFSNWTYASSRVFVSPFSWVDAGPRPFERARSPSAVADQLQAFRTWGTGGEFLNFAFNLPAFDYGPYADGLRAASTPGVVDGRPPDLRVTSVVPNGTGLDIAGTAHDNLGIRAVMVGDGRAATMTWRVTGGDHSSGWKWEMAWDLKGVAVPAGATSVTVTAVDIKGLETTVQAPLPA